MLQSIETVATKWFKRVGVPSVTLFALLQCDHGVLKGFHGNRGPNKGSRSAIFVLLLGLAGKECLSIYGAIQITFMASVTSIHEKGIPTDTAAGP